MMKAIITKIIIFPAIKIIRILVLLFLVILLIFVGGTLYFYIMKPSINSLSKEFYKQKKDFDEFRLLLEKFRDNTGLKGIVITNDSRMLRYKDEQEKDLDNILRTSSGETKEDLIKMEGVAKRLGIVAASFSIKDNSLLIITYGGGVLGSNYGYIYSEKGDIKQYHLISYRKLNNEKNWYAIID